MRYRDRPTVEVERRLPVSAEQAWDLVTDIALSARHSPECIGAVWQDGSTTVALGARFVGHNRNEILGEWTTECEVVEVEPLRRWVYDVRAGGNHMASWGFEVDPSSDNSAVTVRQWGRVGPDKSGISLAIDAMPDKEGRIMSRRMQEWRSGIEATLDGLAAELDRPA